MGNDGNFSPHRRVQTGFRAHPASYPMGIRGLFPWAQSSLGMKLTTHLDLMPRLRLHGAVLPLLHTSSWYGA